MRTPRIIKEAGLLKTVGKVVSYPFKSTKLTSGQAKNLLRNPAMKSYYQRAMKGNKFLSKGYFREIAQDVRHPIQSLKRQAKLVRYGVGKGGTISKRSPFSQAWHGGMYFGAPAVYAADRLREKDKTSKNEVLAGAEIASMITPKMMPYFAMTELPKLFYKKKKQTV